MTDITIRIKGPPIQVENEKIRRRIQRQIKDEMLVKATLAMQSILGTEFTVCKKGNIILYSKKAVIQRVIQNENRGHQHGED